jgi:hypothetical protein
LEPQYKAKSRGNHRQGERSDQDEARPRFHKTNSDTGEMN